MQKHVLPEHADHTTSSFQALERLLDGNRRFSTGTSSHPNITPEHRKKVAAAQAPFAAICSCTDSRVPPEIIFDQGVGDLFVVRTAAHILDRAAMGSIEFGVQELGVPLVVVLGHTCCGAVAATIKALDEVRTVAGDIQILVDAIRPAVDEARKTDGDVILSAIVVNITSTLNKLLESEIISGSVSENRLRVIGALYDLDTGEVGILNP